jgi:DNA-binding CsgD family transcriptional regulator
MTLRGATDGEIARAVKHSMVVIDAHKHKLDYKQSEKDNGIAELKNRWQTRLGDDGDEKAGGASTLLSRRQQTIDVPERKGSPQIDPETGKVTYKQSGRTYVNKDGKVVNATTKVKRIIDVDDVRTLSSGTPQENAYADYANYMKDLANRARKESVNTGKIAYSKNAKTVYSNEVESLNAKLNVAAMNAPRERRANIIANSVVKAKQQDNPDMDKKEVKKAKQIAINNARAAVGASGKGTRIVITDREWEAIQAGAISDSKLSEILRYADTDTLRQRATPKSTTALSAAKQGKMKAMMASGYTNAEIAEALGVSTSTISKYMSN